MKESEFIDQNKAKWGKYETILNKNNYDPEELREVFIQVTDDLSYSRTFYNNRSVRVYLNGLATGIFDKLNARKKMSFQAVGEFFKITVPQILFEARKDMLFSLIVFLFSMAVGVYSSRQDPGFAQLILGERYVQMTEQNIDNDDPMAVYRGGKDIDGFLMILYNNARIDILLLGLGMLFGVGALLVLIRNGIMVGVFQYFFYAHGGFKDSLLTIWLHGTIEITTIIIVGGIGILAGRGWLFPGTYTRVQSFMKTAKMAGMLTLAILPFTFVAALIEGFITRQTGAPDLIKISLILVSLAFVVFYFYWYPRVVVRRHGKYEHKHATSKGSLQGFEWLNPRKPAKNWLTSFRFFSDQSGPYLTTIALWSIGMLILATWLYDAYLTAMSAPSFFRMMINTIRGAAGISFETPMDIQSPSSFFIGVYALWNAFLIAAARYILKARVANGKPPHQLKSFLFTVLYTAPAFLLTVYYDHFIAYAGQYLLLTLAIFLVEHQFRNEESQGASFPDIFGRSIGKLVILTLISIGFLMLIMNILDAQLGVFFQYLFIDMVPSEIISMETFSMYWGSFIKQFFYGLFAVILTLATILQYYASVESVLGIKLGQELNRLNPGFHEN
jgi:uncharacterized membrane protein SpoIIM required for sporulation